MSDVSQPLVQEFLEIFQNDSEKLTFRQAVVQAGSPAGKCRIRLGGQLPDIDASKFSWYAPVAGHTVWCLMNASDIVVLGELG